jgi:16S rRNA (guanine(966)-N(2))-methyltransferase RsmD
VTRIVAGTAGSRRLVMPRGRATRPTSERVREALFSTIAAMQPAPGAFLDLYAGSGAVGLEAASRGATSVVLVENDPAALTALRANAAELALPGVVLRAEPVERFLDTDAEAGFDVVFLDPPYVDSVDQVLQALVSNAWLAPAGVVVVERASRSSGVEWPTGITGDRSRRYGDTTLWYGRRS